MASIGKAAGAAAARGRGVVESSSHASSADATPLINQLFNRGGSDSSTVPSAAQKSHPFSSTTGRPPSNDCTTGDGGGEDYFGIWQPNQTTVLFQRMEQSCPDVMQAYAKCVIHKQNSGALVKDACGKEFQAVMDCFRSVR
mmetsp:Transcript_42906/g.73189  ORF Transcript_42906/g.73189 Transcript_42906/m.73189 type:complete len:141 (+) Transcript_42906:237-659(+)